MNEIKEASNDLRDFLMENVGLKKSKPQQIQTSPNFSVKQPVKTRNDISGVDHTFVPGTKRSGPKLTNDPESGKTYEVFTDHNGEIKRKNQVQVISEDQIPQVIGSAGGTFVFIGFWEKTAKSPTYRHMNGTITKKFFDDPQNPNWTRIAITDLSLGETRQATREGIDFIRIKGNTFIVNRQSPYAHADGKTDYDNQALSMAKETNSFYSHPDDRGEEDPETELKENPGESKMASLNNIFEKSLNKVSQTQSVDQQTVAKPIPAASEVTTTSEAPKFTPEDFSGKNVEKPAVVENKVEEKVREVSKSDSIKKLINDIFYDNNVLSETFISSCGGRIDAKSFSSISANINEIAAKLQELYGQLQSSGAIKNNNVVTY